MARKSKQINLTAQELETLTLGYEQGDTHCFRHRCKIVLLKSEGYTSKEVAFIMNTNNISVHNWVNRYKKDGIVGLKTKAGQGRKPILEAEHLSIVRAAVQQERQRLSQARQIIENNLDKKMSNETLTRFLKVITAVTSE